MHNILIFQELKKRETIVAKKEAMLAEKSEIEFRRMRSSQIINKVTLFCQKAVLYFFIYLLLFVKQFIAC